MSGNSSRPGGTRWNAPHVFAGNGSVQMCNLVDGEGAVISSPDGRFPDYCVHYAETFILPASLHSFVIRPLGDSCTVLRAYVRG